MADPKAFQSLSELTGAAPSIAKLDLGVTDDAVLLTVLGNVRFEFCGSQCSTLSVSKLFRNVPFLTSLEMSLFLLICLLSLGCPPSEALRRGLCGAFRA